MIWLFISYLLWYLTICKGIKSWVGRYRIFTLMLWSKFWCHMVFNYLSTNLKYGFFWITLVSRFQSVNYVQMKSYNQYLKHISTGKIAFRINESCRVSLLTTTKVKKKTIGNEHIPVKICGIRWGPTLCQCQWILTSDVTVYITNCRCVCLHAI